MEMISNLANNAAEKCQGKQSHTKINKAAKLEEKHRQLEAQRLMKTDSRQALQASLKFVKEMVGGRGQLNISTATQDGFNPTTLTCEQPRKRTPVSAEFVIGLPRPYDGREIYFPCQTVSLV